jgi:hypothetical protein
VREPYAHREIEQLLTRLILIVNPTHVATPA